MSYYYKDQFVDNSYNTNIFVACFTTSIARLMFYHKLQVLYFDTDSIVYIESPNSTEITTGDLLGELTELDSGSIKDTFVSGGPKNYSCIYGSNKQRCVVKSFRQNKQIVNKYEEKVYSFGYDKRAIKHIFENCIETYPYGY